tara:strand:- start:5913 stop:6350 length:438 start_codon:yes stop_codon:yes gene_type:complete
LLKEDLEVFSKEELVNMYLELTFELERVQKAFAEQAAVTAHDINNPLTIALFNLQVLKKSIDKEKLDFGNKADKALNAMERIKEIIKNLSSQVSSSKESIEVFDLNTIISEEAELLVDSDKDVGLRLKLLIPKSNKVLAQPKKVV